MTMAEPPPDPDDVLAGLDFTVDEPELIDLAALTVQERTSQVLVDKVIAGGVVDVTKLDAQSLSAFRTWVRERLLNLGEMHTPPAERSDAGEALHSVWIACHVEWQKRRP